MLGPHIPEQIGADRAGARLYIVAIFLVQLGARVTMQLLVERLDLRPQALDFRFHFFRRHVVARQPHLIQAREAQFLGAFIGDLDHAGIVILHRRRDRTPAFPDGFQLFRVAAGFDDRGQLVQIERFALIGELAGAIGGVQIGRYLGKLFRRAGGRRGWNGDAGAQDVHLAGKVCRQDIHIELLGLIGQRHGQLGRDSTGLCGCSIGLVRDVGRLVPVGLRGNLALRGQLCFRHL